MKQIVVLSGKGGTGKTSVTASLAVLAAAERRTVLVDADVDAANLGIVLRPEIRETHAFEGAKLAVVDRDRCALCGECQDACRFDAIPEPGVVDALACEGCAACAYRCPLEAISMQPVVTGDWFASDTACGPLYHARLRAGQEGSGKLVTELKRAAAARAAHDAAELVLVDGPPGIACPVIASLAGADLAVLVTEPSVSAASDLDRALGAVRHFGIDAIAVVNKADLSEEWAARIERYGREQGIEVALRLPFDPAVTQAMVRRQAAAMADGSPFGAAIRGLWRRIRG